MTQRVVENVVSFAQWAKDEIGRDSVAGGFFLPLVLAIAAWCESPFLLKRQAKGVKMVITDIRGVCKEKVGCVLCV